MTELYEKSLRTLEFPRVLEMLAGQCVTQEAKERAMKLRPSTEEREVQRLMDETTAARDMMDLHGAPSFSGIKPVGAALQRAELGGGSGVLLSVLPRLTGRRRPQSSSSKGPEAS